MGVDDLTKQITGVTKRTFKKLRRGKFIVQIGNSEPYTIKNSTWLLGNKHNMSEKAWQGIVQEQLKHYYKERSVEQHTSIPNSDNNNSGFRRPFKKNLNIYANITNEGSDA